MVPLLDLKRQYRSLKAELDQAVLAVCEAQAFILGPEVEHLEAELAQFSGTKYALGLSSGTDALLLAFMALGLKPGDEVITSPFTFFATVGTLDRLGVCAVFADIDPDTFNIDPNQVESRITSKTQAILPVHLFGQCADMAPLNAIAARHGLTVIEDAAQAIGAEYPVQTDSGVEIRKACNLGFAGCLSFFPSKNLGAFGDAGALLTNDEEYFQRAKALRVHGGIRTYFHEEVGGNFRIDALQAAVLRVKLRHLDAWSQGRIANAELYAKLFAEAGLSRTGGPIHLPKLSAVAQTALASPAHPPLRYAHIYNQYTIRTRERDALREHLNKHQVGNNVYYPLCLHLQPCFKHLGYAPGDFPEAERASAEVLSLPIFPELSHAEIAEVVAAIASFYRL